MSELSARSAILLLFHELHFKSGNLLTWTNEDFMLIFSDRVDSKNNFTVPTVFIFKQFQVNV